MVFPSTFLFSARVSLMTPVNRDMKEPLDVTDTDLVEPSWCYLWGSNPKSSPSSLSYVTFVASLDQGDGIGFTEFMGA